MIIFNSPARNSGAIIVNVYVLRHILTSELVYVKPYCLYILVILSLAILLEMLDIRIVYGYNEGRPRFLLF